MDRECVINTTSGQAGDPRRREGEVGDVIEEWIDVRILIVSSDITGVDRRADPHCVLSDH